LDNEQMIVAFNIGVRRSAFELQLSAVTGEAACFEAVWGEGSYLAQHGKLSDVSIPGRSALVLKRKEGN
jgi:hypothetical protein